MSEAMTIPPLGEAPAKRTPTVYFIDDSATMREVIKIAFRRENINVITCADAASALAQFEQNRPDVVITDVIMPGLNGRQLANEILKVRPGMKVLFTSGYTENAIVHHGRLDPGVLLLPKPYRKTDLARMIRLAIDGSAPSASGRGDTLITKTG